MSTRAQIGFYGSSDSSLSAWDALIYKHCDGYPEGVLPLLTAFLREFRAVRGSHDVEYASAWYVAALAKERSAQGVSPFLGVGVCKDFHGDIEYFYAVFPNRLEVYEVGFGNPLERARLIQTLSYGGSEKPARPRTVVLSLHLGDRS